MKKLLVVSALSASVFAGSASALTVDQSVSWVQKTAAGVATSLSGATTAGSLVYDIAQTPLNDVNNQPSYRVDFSITGPATIAGFTFDHTEWQIGTINFAGGSATSSNPGGSVISTLSSSTNSIVGTTLFGSQLVTSAQSVATAGGSFTGSPQLANPTISLTDATTTFLSGWLNNNALNLFALATALDSFTSDGNSASTFVNYSQFAIQARHVYNEIPTTQVPEPAMLGLMGLGFAAMGATRRRRQA